jgi:hypothetical protein
VVAVTVVPPAAGVVIVVPRVFAVVTVVDPVFAAVTGGRIEPQRRPQTTLEKQQP